MITLTQSKDGLEVPLYINPIHIVAFEPIVYTGSDTYNGINKTYIYISERLVFRVIETYETVLQILNNNRG